MLWRWSDIFSDKGDRDRVEGKRQCCTFLKIYSQNTFFDKGDRVGGRGQCCTLLKMSKSLFFLALAILVAFNEFEGFLF